MLSFKQFLIEAKRERVEYKPITLYHGSTDYIFPEEQIDLRRGEFYTTPDPNIATEYAFNKFSKDAATSGKSATDPTVLRFETDANKFITLQTRNRQAPGDQASRRISTAKGRIAKELKSADAPNVEAQVWRLLNAGKGTQGQRKFSGEIGGIRGVEARQYVIPQQSRINITRTGTTAEIENNGELKFIPQNTPQTNIRLPNKRPNIGVSGFQGIQLTGPRLTKIAKNIKDRGSYFDLAPLDGDGDYIHPSLDPDDPLHRPQR